MLQPTETKEGEVTTKIVTKRLASGEVKRYRYYQLVRSFRKGKKVKHKYLRYLGKLPPPDVTANQNPSPETVTANRAIHPNQMELFSVTANQALPPLDLEEIPPKEEGFWSFPLYRATCRRCGRKFEMIKFEVEMGHYLCHKCRFEIIRLGERAAWPGY